MGYSSGEAKAFISRMAPIIKRIGTERGYKVVSTTIAQAIIEGAAGTSTLAKAYHNHFGMKCGSSWKGKSVNLRTKEEYNSQLVSIYDNFRVYDNDEQGVEGYYDFISAKRYANLKQAVDYRQFAEYLKSDGYATSSSYVNTLCNTVKKYNLWTYDDNSGLSEYFPKFTGTGSSIAAALESLGIDNSQGYRKKIYAKNFSDKYEFSASQNLAMLELLRKGELKRP